MGATALAGLEEVISRNPELSMAVPGHEKFRCRPIHTDHGSFLIVFAVDAKSVTLLSMRPVPSDAY